MKDNGCLGALLYVFILAAIAIVPAALGISMGAVSAAIFSIVISGVVCFAVFSALFPQMDGRKGVLFVSSIIAGAIALFMLFINVFSIEVFESDNERPSTRPLSATTEKLSTEDKYRILYPSTWAYIYKNAEDPYEYIEYYNSVWGDLQRYHGDGITFDTLTSYEQTLVNYPGIGNYVYKASKTSKTYHSTTKCYTLLKSTPVLTFAYNTRGLDPCSKCVGE